MYCRREQTVQLLNPCWCASTFLACSCGMMCMKSVCVVLGSSETLD